MIEEFFTEAEEEEAIQIELWLWDSSWIVTKIKNWGCVEEALNEEGIRYNDQDGAFYEA